MKQSDKVKRKRGSIPVHGATTNYERTKGYLAWIAMKSNCCNENSNNYRFYGAKGITICDRWIFSFQNFIEDMGEPKNDKQCLLRKNKKLGYSKENCYWGEHIKTYTYQGESKTLTQWAHMFNIKPGTLSARIYHYKWSLDKALNTPVRGKKS